VMPEFHAHEPKHQAWKRAVLAREIELPEVDVAAYTRANMAKPTIAPGAERETIRGA